MNLGELDQQEFGGLVQQYQPELLVHCYRLLGSICDAEDMVQEAFLRAWRGRETFQGTGSLRAWLYKIGTNVCLDYLKKSSRRYVPRTRTAAADLEEPIPAAVREQIWLEPFPDDLLAIEEHNPERQIIEQETIRLAFVVALQVLPPRQRAVLILRDVLDWQANEVAALMNTSVSAVKSALHRARAALAEQHIPAVAYAPDDGFQSLLEDYVQAWEAGDASAFAALLLDNATFSMPPIPAWYQGRATIRELVSRTVFSGDAQGRWLLLPAHANRQPAFGLYRKTDVPGVFRAYGIQVITVQGKQVTDVISFNNEILFTYFGLPPAVNHVG
jgi:RNA polymerase sigma-70 factor (ECF subfamily)